MSICVHNISGADRVSSKRHDRGTVQTDGPGTGPHKCGASMIFASAVVSTHVSTTASIPWPSTARNAWPYGFIRCSQRRPASELSRALRPIGFAEAETQTGSADPATTLSPRDGEGIPCFRRSAAPRRGQRARYLLAGVDGRCKRFFTAVMRVVRRRSVGRALQAHRDAHLCRQRASERQQVGMHFSDAQPAVVATIASSSIRLYIRFLITSPSLIFVIGSLRQRAAAPTRPRKTWFATAQDADAACTDRHTDHRSVPPAVRPVRSWKCARRRT